MSALRPFAALAALALLAACQADGPVAVAAYGSDDLVDTPAHRLEALNTLDARVNEVGYRLAIANTELCPHTGAVTGLLFHSASQYSDYLRPAAQARWALEGDLPGVAAVAPGSPGARAGLKVGDLVLAVDGTPLSRGTPGAPAAFEGLAANLARLDTAFARGETLLRIRRDGVEQDVRLRPAEGCAYVYQVDPSTELNAHADGKRVYIASALAAFAETDADLAVVLGHEMAHNVLEHRAFFDERGFARSILGNYGNAPWELVAAEREADRLGLYLMARAGYDPAQAPMFWRALSDRNPALRYAQWGHPSARSRIRAHEAVVAEIRRLQADNLPLLPSPASVARDDRPGRAPGGH